MERQQTVYYEFNKESTSTTSAKVAEQLASVFPEQNPKTFNGRIHPQAFLLKGNDVNAVVMPGRKPTVVSIGVVGLESAVNEFDEQIKTVLKGAVRLVTMYHFDPITSKYAKTN